MPITALYLTGFSHINLSGVVQFRRLLQDKRLEVLFLRT